MKVFLLSIVVLAVTAAAPSRSNRIVGGSVADISQYPFVVAMLVSESGSDNFRYYCGGAIVSNRSILSAANCFYRLNQPNRWRGRVGSSFSQSDGVVHAISRIIIHPRFNENVLWNNDIAVLRVSSVFTFNDNYMAGRIAGPNDILHENQPVWAMGWGSLYDLGPLSEQLRHVELRTVNQAECRRRYGQNRITDGMLCAGWLDVGGRDQCQGDAGGPVLYNDTIVGVCSWGRRCALASYPGVNARVSFYSPWINSNR